MTMAKCFAMFCLVSVLSATANAELTVTFDATGFGPNDDRNIGNFYGVGVSGDSDDYIETLRMEISPTTDFYWAFLKFNAILEEDLGQVLSGDVIDGVAVGSLLHPYREVIVGFPGNIQFDNTDLITLTFPPEYLESGESFRFSLDISIFPVRPPGSNGKVPGGEWADVLHITATSGSGLSDTATLQFVDRFQSIATLTLVPEPSTVFLALGLVVPFGVLIRSRFCGH